MVLASLAIVFGLVILLWSANLFIDGSSSTARHLGMPPLLIGMVIVGFGTSAPEMIVSAMAALQSNPSIALGNAYGSNITNIALILGLVGVIKPISVHSQVLKKELPLLLVVTAIAAYQLLDNQLSRGDAFGLLLVFFAVMGWTIFQGLRNKSDALGSEMESELTNVMPLKKALLWVFFGLVVLIGSSRLFVWGAVEVAHALGVSDLIVGLTVVAIGTSLPELASSLVAIRRNEHDIALGNVLGSNLFNTLAVVGIAGAIHPLEVSPDIMNRDIPVMSLLTLLLLIFGWGFRKTGRINRIEASILLSSFIAYTSYLILTAF